MYTISHMATSEIMRSPFLTVDQIHHGRSEFLMSQIEPESISLSFWSPPYFVGKEYEKDETFDSWQKILRQVIHHHAQVLKPGGFLVINIADILCFKDETIPRFQAMNLSMQKSKITKEMVSAMVPQELPKIREYLGEAGWALGKYEEAAAMFEQMCLDDNFVEFLTLPAYDKID